MGDVKKKLREAQRALTDLLGSIERHEHLKEDHRARYEMSEIVDEFNDVYEYLDTHPHLKKGSQTQPLKTRRDYGGDPLDTLPPVDEEKKSKEGKEKMAAKVVSEFLSK